MAEGNVEVVLNSTDKDMKPKKHQLAEIHYQEFANGTVLIKKLVNFYTRSEIADKYGLPILETYLKGRPVMYRLDIAGSAAPLVISMFPDPEEGHRPELFLKEGDLLTKKLFTQFKNHFKECGKHLHSVLMDARLGEIKVFKI
jgi:hypothetical protein